MYLLFKLNESLKKFDNMIFFDVVVILVIFLN